MQTRPNFPALYSTVPTSIPSMGPRGRVDETRSNIKYYRNTAVQMVAETVSHFTFSSEVLPERSHKRSDNFPAFFDGPLSYQ